MRGCSSRRARSFKPRSRLSGTAGEAGEYRKILDVLLSFLLENFLKCLQNLFSSVHRVENILPQTVPQAQGDHLFDIFLLDLLPALISSVCPSRAISHDVAAK